MAPLPDPDLATPETPTVLVSIVPTQVPKPAGWLTLRAVQTASRKVLWLS